MASQSSRTPPVRRRPARPGLRAPSTKARRVGRDEPVRFAVVGLGYFAQSAVLPAFKDADGVELAALVSDDPVKMRRLGKRYDVPTQVLYEDYDDLLASGQVDAVYIALPNDLHADFTLRAARAGVHVLCEKPLATSANDARRMVEACRRADVRLMTAYRLHFEPGNLRAIQAITDGEIGDPRVFDSAFTTQVKPTGIRTEAERGGGPLFDIGIYCINAARYLFRAEPTSVVAEVIEGKGKRFREVEEAVSAILTFPEGRVATFVASFGASDIAYYTVIGTTGYVCLDSAYEHTEARHLEVGGEGRPRKDRFRKVDQVAPELMHFADCVRSGRDPEPSGKEGLIDVRIIEAIQRSAATGRRVRLSPLPRRRRRPSTRQEMRVGRDRRPKLVRAEIPFR
jgi:predicted dehydrogenase